MNKNLLITLISILCAATNHAPPKEKRRREDSTAEIPPARRESPLVRKTRSQELEEAIAWVASSPTNPHELALAHANFECAKRAHEKELAEKEALENHEKAREEALFSTNTNDQEMLERIYASASDSVINARTKLIMVPRYTIKFCSKFNAQYIKDEIIASAIINLQCGVASVTAYTGDYLPGFCKLEAGKHDSRIFFTVDEASHTLTIHFAAPKSMAPETSTNKKNKRFIDTHSDCC